jgi:hypothetical protein
MKHVRMYIVNEVYKLMCHVFTILNGKKWGFDKT